MLSVNVMKHFCPKKSFYFLDVLFISSQGVLYTILADMQADIVLILNVQRSNVNLRDEIMKLCKAVMLIFNF